mmetsp:Transcript_13236/g.35421  ORF Transcript_13236/g.35421 Transcript_13236/m.35421 type:complete len:758 (+) Transcript_13236:3-2276(+)
MAEATAVTGLDYAVSVSAAQAMDLMVSLHDGLRAKGLGAIFTPAPTVEPTDTPTPEPTPRPTKPWATVAFGGEIDVGVSFDDLEADADFVAAMADACARILNYGDGAGSHCMVKLTPGLVLAFQANITLQKAAAVIAKGPLSDAEVSSIFTEEADEAAALSDTQYGVTVSAAQSRAVMLSLHGGFLDAGFGGIFPPTVVPSLAPSATPTLKPTTATPTGKPTAIPTTEPSLAPTSMPTAAAFKVVEDGVDPTRFNSGAFSQEVAKSLGMPASDVYVTAAFDVKATYMLKDIAGQATDDAAKAALRKVSAVEPDAKVAVAFTYMAIVAYEFTTPEGEPTEDEIKAAVAKVARVSVFQVFVDTVPFRRLDGRRLSTVSAGVAIILPRDVVATVGERVNDEDAIETEFARKGKSVTAKVIQEAATQVTMDATIVTTDAEMAKSAMDTMTAAGLKEALELQGVNASVGELEKPKATATVTASIVTEPPSSGGKTAVQQALMKHFRTPSPTPRPTEEQLPVTFEATISSLLNATALEADDAIVGGLRAFCSLVMRLEALNGSRCGSRFVDDGQGSVTITYVALVTAMEADVIADVGPFGVETMQTILAEETAAVAAATGSNYGIAMSSDRARAARLSLHRGLLAAGFAGLLPPSAAPTSMPTPRPTPTPTLSPPTPAPSSSPTEVPVAPTAAAEETDPASVPLVIVTILVIGCMLVTCCCSYYYCRSNKQDNGPQSSESAQEERPPPVKTTSRKAASAALQV